MPSELNFAPYPEGTFVSDSHETALCILLPKNQWPAVDRLRFLNDKAYGKWPPHINLIYPFVRRNSLRNAFDALSKAGSFLGGVLSEFSLQEVGAFHHKRNNTVFLRPDGDSLDSVKQLASRVRQVLGLESDNSFQPHLTVCQTKDSHSATHAFYLEKARLLTPLKWRITELAILTRDIAEGAPKIINPVMNLWASVDVTRSGEAEPVPAMMRFYDDGVLSGAQSDNRLESELRDESTFHFNESLQTWVAVQPLHSNLVPAEHHEKRFCDRLIVASYNVLAEFTWPPSLNRYAALAKNILSDRALADILVLQEMTDEFLSFLLDNSSIQKRYPFSTHAPPRQFGSGPLPSLLNVVVLSRFQFEWQYAPFQRKHKGLALVKLPGLVVAEPDERPLVLAACHLTQGLVDAAVAAKKNEILRLLNLLSRKFPDHPWIIAGDFNISTSSFTIESARKKKDLSTQGLRYLKDIEAMFVDYGLQDGWIMARVEGGDSSSSHSTQHNAMNLFEGEQGATFDPITNYQAADLAGGGLNNRPQRYDRILVNEQYPLRPARFNMFGLDTINMDMQDLKPMHASDHWGIRCLFGPQIAQGEESFQPIRASPVRLRKAQASLGGLEELKSCLLTHEALPTETGSQKRQSAISLLEQTIIGDDITPNQNTNSRGLSIVLVPVGSYGLGIWTDDSDLDCLCLGSITSRTFFALAIQRLRKVAARGVTIIRRVKAASGTMLELDVIGVKVDLQYCPAAAIAASYPEVMKRPSADPVFALPLATLAKLKPLRDMSYLCRSIPDIAQYRLAHLLLKAWAKTRGLYSARFGLLGGINISALLVPICKALAGDGQPVTTQDILVTFFNHYSSFDWKQRVVMDPFFHRDLRYNRTFREPLCLLGWHAPALNTASNASVPTMATLSAELQRANELLSQHDMDWNTFLDVHPEIDAFRMGVQENLSPGASDFLTSYKAFAKLDLHYWGSSMAEGNQFVGWVESRCVMLLVDIERKFPGLSARIWPKRFTEKPTTKTLTTTTNLECHGCYLVGLRWHEDTSSARRTDEARDMENDLHLAFREFETRLKTDERYFDKHLMYFSVTLSKGRSVRHLIIDESKWGECGWDDDLGSDEEDEETGEDEAGASSNIATDSKGVHDGQVKQKLRSAMDVLNRLRWDTAFDSSNFVVGYKDRFIGAQEKPLEAWRSESTDEEFIPQHRILYFKNKDDGQLVWERKSRMDKIFGSGLGFAK